MLSFCYILPLPSGDRPALYGLDLIGQMINKFNSFLKLFHTLQNAVMLWYLSLQTWLVIFLIFSNGLFMRLLQFTDLK